MTLLVLLTTVFQGYDQQELAKGHQVYLHMVGGERLVDEWKS